MEGSIVGKFIKLMADYSSTGLWCEYGTNLGPHNLPVSKELHERIRLWCEEYEKNDDWLPIDERSGVFDLRLFAANGLEIAKAIKEELPDWTVIYFDEYELDRQYLNAHHNRDAYVYEVIL